MRTQKRDHLFAGIHNCETIRRTLFDNLLCTSCQMKVERKFRPSDSWRPKTFRFRIMIWHKVIIDMTDAIDGNHAFVANEYQITIIYSITNVVFSSFQVSSHRFKNNGFKRIPIYDIRLIGWNIRIDIFANNEHTSEDCVRSHWSERISDPIMSYTRILFSEP